MTDWILVPSEGMSEELRRKHLHALSEAFGVSGYANTFPVVFSKGTTGAMHCLALAGDDPVAGASFLPIRATWNPDTSSSHFLSFVCVGSVFVTQAARGQGLAKETLERTLKAVRKAHFAGAVLFAYDQRLYRKIGFEACSPDLLAGLSEILSDLKKQPSTSSYSAGLRSSLVPAAKLSLSQAAELWRFWSENQSPPSGSPRVILSFAGWQTFLQTRPLSILSIREAKTDHVVALAFLGKGADFPKTWHGLILDRRLSPTSRHDLLDALCREALSSCAGSQIHFPSIRDELLPFLDPRLSVAEVQAAMVLPFKAQWQEAMRSICLPTPLSI